MPVTEESGNRQPHVLNHFVEGDAGEVGTIRPHEVRYVELTIIDCRNDANTNIKFMFFFVNDHLAPTNQCIRPGRNWLGSLIIMRLGVRRPMGPINIRGGGLGAGAVWRFALSKYVV